MILHRLYSNNCKNSIKVPNQISTFINSLPKSEQGKDKGKLKDDHLDQQIDEWLNDKGLNSFLFEFKNGNMIGAKY